MFVRVTWTRSPRDESAAVRRVDLPARRAADDLGIPARDFSKMTRALFDRHG